MNDTMWSFVDYTCRFAWSVMRGICCNIHEHRCVSHGLPLQCGTLCFNAAELLQFFELVHLMKMVGGKLSVRKVVSASPPRAQAPTSLLTCRNRLAARLGSPWRVGVARGCSAQHVATGRLVSQLYNGSLPGARYLHPERRDAAGRRAGAVPTLICAGTVD
jgi:hypothetical protein